MKCCNTLYYGDNLEILRNKIDRESIDLCYIDPPFNSKRNYNQIYNNVGGEDKAQAQAFIDTWTWDDEAVKGLEQITSNYNGVFTKQSIELIAGLEKVLGKGDLLAYLISMTLRIAEIFRVLKQTGSFYLHCDPTSSHYLKLVLDSIFCAKGGDYINEIVWCYTSGGKSSRKYAKKHDTIFFYTKSNAYTFNDKDIRIPYSAKTLANYKPGLKGSTYTADVVLNEYGKMPEDYWEIAIASKSTKEYLGYPTQKPEALLERIIKGSSNKGDVILDAYCGCGTSIYVAEKLKRNWIGIDITYQSISLILKRLDDSFGKQVLEGIAIDGIPKDFKSAEELAHKKNDKTRKEFEKWAVLTYSNNKAMINEKKGGDGGIDGIAFMQDRNENQVNELRQVLFSVKSDKKPHVSHIRDLHGTIEREKAAIGYFITLYPPTKEMIAECKKLDKYKNRLMDREYPKIEIVTIDEIVNGGRITIPIGHQVDVVKSAKAHVVGEQSEFTVDKLL